MRYFVLQRQATYSLHGFLRMAYSTMQSRSIPPALLDKIRSGQTKSCCMVDRDHQKEVVMKYLRHSNVPFTAGWVGAYVLTGLAFVDVVPDYAGIWLVILPPAVWLLAILLTLWMLDRKNRSLLWVFLVIVPCGWLFLLPLRTTVSRQPVAEREPLGARAVLTVVLLAICSLVFLGSAVEGMYFNLRPAPYSGTIQKATAIPVFLCFFSIGLIWGRHATRIARGLES